MELPELTLELENLRRQLANRERDWAEVREARKWEAEALASKNRQIETLQNQLKEASERHHFVVMVDNGLSYDEHCVFVEAVFSTLQDAVDFCAVAEPKVAHYGTPMTKVEAFYIMEFVDRHNVRDFSWDGKEQQ